MLNLINIIIKISLKQGIKVAKISSILLFIIALFIFSSISPAYAEPESVDYVRFTSLKGAASFASTKTRRIHFNQDWGDYYNAPDDWKKALLQPFWNDDYYNPEIGHVAKVITSNKVLEASHFHPYRLLVRVSNNLLMYPPTSFEKASKSDYEKFLRDREKLGSEFFDFRLNISTIEEVKSSLKSKGIKIDRRRISKDGLNSINIEISKGSIIPEFWGISADKMIFSFVDGRLSSIGFSIGAETAKNMYAAADAERPNFQFFNFSNLISDIIKGKYDVNGSSVGGSPDNHSYFYPDYESFTTHFWVSTNTVIALHKPPRPTGSYQLALVVEYHHIPVYSRFSREREAAVKKAEEQESRAKAQEALRKKKELESQI
jgi:hypothetical protein